MLGAAFVRKDLEIEGDLLRVFDFAEFHCQAAPGLHRMLLRSWNNLQLTLRHGRRHSPARDKTSISLHCDQPVAFYRLWLGPALVYSCAY